MKPDEKFLTVREVAEMMRLSKMTVYRMITNGDLTAHQFGRSYRIATAEVAAYMAASRTSAKLWYH